MEEKLKREAKPYLEKLFKKYDELGSGAVSKNQMRAIMELITPGFDEFGELEEIMLEHARSNKYTCLNSTTKQMEVKYQPDSIDFPSALTVIVYFLKKQQKKNYDCFSGQGLIRFDSLPQSKPMVDKLTEAKKRMY